MRGHKGCIAAYRRSMRAGGSYRGSALRSSVRDTGVRSEAECGASLFRGIGDWGRRLFWSFALLGCITCLPGSVRAHLPADFTYFAVQFPDTYLPMLDGDLSEWDILAEKYIVYTEDMYGHLACRNKGGGPCLNLSDLALRSACGWNDSTNRLYFMAEVFDDIHQTDRANPQCNWTDDCWEIMIDANHSGGRHAWFSDLTEEENKRLNGAEGTQCIVAEPPVQDVDFTTGNASTWTSEPGDYYDIGWDFTGDEFGESTYYYELFIYPFSDLNWEGPDVSRHHDLTEGEIVGIGLAFGDFDELSDSYDSYWTISGGDATCGLSEALADVFMSPMDPALEGAVIDGAAVEADTWGRIKSTFAE